MRDFLLTAAALVTLASPAFGQPAEIPDPYGAKSISIGRTDTIARKLEAAYQRGDRSTEVLLNLAAIRIQQKDLKGAETLYQEILAQPNTDMDTLNGSAWSHDIARRAMATAVAAR
jgi:thioredoxin-like negative regulator of GroEL